MIALELCFKLGMFPSLVVISQIMVLKNSGEWKAFHLFKKTSLQL